MHHARARARVIVAFGSEAFLNSPLPRAELLKAVYPRKREVEAPNVGGGRSLATAWSAASARASRYLSHKFLYSLLIHIANRLASQFVGVVNKLHFFVITRIIYFPLNRP